MAKWSLDKYKKIVIENGDRPFSDLSKSEAKRLSKAYALLIRRLGKENVAKLLTHSLY